MRRSAVDESEFLADLGYKQELKRNFGLVSMIGFAFSITASWCAMAGSLAVTMQNGGPATLIYGWIGTCALSFCVTLILAELCSAYPVAGGQYSWCLLLARDTNWGRAVSYICGWIQVSGSVGLAAVGYYQFGNAVSAVIRLNNENFSAENWQVALLGYACGLISVSITIFGIKIFDIIGTAALWVLVGGFIICTVVPLACASTFQQPRFVFTTVTNEGWSSTGMAVVLGLMQCAFGICGYDSVSHLSEETEDAARKSPLAMLLCIPISFITAFAFVIAIFFSIQDLDKVLNTPTGYPLLEIFYQSTSSKAGSTCLLVIFMILFILASTSLTTNASRSIYALARDGAFPFHLNKWLMWVHPILNIPVYAALLTGVIAFGLVAILFGSSTAFFTVMSIGSTGLYVSYLITLSVYVIRHRHKIPGQFDLGNWGLAVSVPGLLFLLFCCIFFFFPTQMPVTGNNMNYNVVAFSIILILAACSWVCGARRTYIRDIGIVEGRDLMEASTPSLKDEKNV